MSLEDSSPVSVGELIANKYRVERVIGCGGMGVVVAAMHTTLNERRAIKFLLPHACGDPIAIERFMREARAAVKLKSEHAIDIHDIGRLDNGMPYMVLEYLEGSSLSELLKRQGPLPVQHVASWVVEALEALAEAHQIGIVHRDLKPANLFLATTALGRPRIKVLDFGISKLVGPRSRGQASLTDADGIVGSPAYMSPEQLRASKDVDARTDIWALGVIMYKLLAAAAPFPSKALFEVITTILTQPPQPLRALRPDTPPEFEQLILRCLEKQVDKRFQNAAELASALVPFASPEAAKLADRIVNFELAVRQSSPGEIPSMLTPAPTDPSAAKAPDAPKPRWPSTVKVAPPTETADTRPVPTRRREQSVPPDEAETRPSSAPRIEAATNPSSAPWVTAETSPPTAQSYPPPPVTPDERRTTPRAAKRGWKSTVPITPSPVSKPPVSASEAPTGKLRPVAPVARVAAPAENPEPPTLRKPHNVANADSSSPLPVEQGSSLWVKIVVGVLFMALGGGAALWFGLTKPRAGPAPVGSVANTSVATATPTARQTAAVAPTALAPASTVGVDALGTRSWMAWRTGWGMGSTTTSTTTRTVASSTTSADTEPASATTDDDDDDPFGRTRK